MRADFLFVPFSVERVIVKALLGMNRQRYTLDVRRLRRMTMSADKMFGLMVNSLGLTVKMLVLKREKKNAQGVDYGATLF